MPAPDTPRRPGAGAGGIRPRPGAGGPTIDDVNDFLDSVTGGLWPIGDGAAAPAGGAGAGAVPAGGKDEDGRRGERVRRWGGFWDACM